jgi:hypothetical protein
MKTNIGIELSDEVRAVLAQNWFGRKTMVSRKEVTDFVNASIQQAILGSEKTDPEPVREAEDAAPVRTEVLRDRGVHNFVPSRGDEPYLYRPKDPKLAAALSTVLNAAEALDMYIWNELERNRQ